MDLLWNPRSKPQRPPLDDQIVVLPVTEIPDLAAELDRA